MSGHLGRSSGAGPRQPSAAHRATLEWLTRDAIRRVEARPAALADGTLLLEAAEAPATGQPAWLRLEEPSSGTPIGGTAVRADGAGRVVLRLYARCPAEVARLVNAGTGRDPAVGRPVR